MLNLAENELEFSSRRNCRSWYKSYACAMFQARFWNLSHLLTEHYSSIVWQNKETTDTEWFSSCSSRYKSSACAMFQARFWNLSHPLTEHYSSIVSEENKETTEWFHVALGTNPTPYEKGCFVRNILIENNSACRFTYIGYSSYSACRVQNNEKHPIICSCITISQ